MVDGDEEHGAKLESFSLPARPASTGISLPHAIEYSYHPQSITDLDQPTLTKSPTEEHPLTTHQSPRSLQNHLVRDPNGASLNNATEDGLRPYAHSAATKQQPILTNFSSQCQKSGTPPVAISHLGWLSQESRLERPDSARDINSDPSTNSTIDASISVSLSRESVSLDRELDDPYPSPFSLLDSQFPTVSANYAESFAGPTTTSIRPSTTAFEALLPTSRETAKHPLPSIADIWQDTSEDHGSSCSVFSSDEGYSCPTTSSTNSTSDIPNSENTSSGASTEFVCSFCARTFSRQYILK